MNDPTAETACVWTPARREQAITEVLEGASLSEVAESLGTDVATIAGLQVYLADVFSVHHTLRDLDDTTTTCTRPHREADDHLPTRQWYE